MSDEPSERDPQVVADLYLAALYNALRGMNAMDDKFLDADVIDEISVGLECLANRIRLMRALDDTPYAPTGVTVQ